MTAKIVLIFYLLVQSSHNVPRSRKSILQEEDGQVMPAGTLINIENLNYDFLITECIGTDNPAGLYFNFLIHSIRLEHKKTLKWLAKYGLISNTFQCPQCQQAEASLVKYNSPDGFTVNLLNFLLFLFYIQWRCNSCRYAMEDEASARFLYVMDLFFKILISLFIKSCVQLIIGLYILLVHYKLSKQKQTYIQRKR